MTNRALIPLGIVFLLLVGTGAVYWWWQGEITRIQDQTHVLAEEIAAANAVREQAALARTQATQIAEQETLINSHIVHPEDIVSFLGYLERVGESLHSTVEVVSVGDVDADGRILVSLTITGNFDAVMRTLGNIEYGTYIVSVKNVTLTTLGDGAWSASGTFLVVATPKTP